MKEINRQKKEISQTYFPNPFHDWPHGRWVWDQTMLLEWSESGVSPGRMAWYLHDSDHRGFVQADDEERSAEIANRMLTKWGFDKGFIELTKTKILGTIFKNRWYDLRPEQLDIADADLSKLWGDYSDFVKNSIRYLLETHPKWEISDTEIIDFFTLNQPWFFKYLTSISKRPETPFLTEWARALYPNFSRNTDFMAKEIELYPEWMISQVRELEKNPHIVKFRNTA
jgi:hypothetical protein